MKKVNKIIKHIIVKINLVKVLSIPLLLFRIFPIKNNKIVFQNFTGRGYGDSPKYIAEELLKTNKNILIYWVVRRKGDIILPDEIKPIYIYSIKYFYIMATSKVWVSNSRLEQYVIKRKNQFYIQTWHGGLALKKIEYDAENKLSEYYRRVMKNDNKMIDVMLSNSDFCTEMYRRAFRYKGEILEIGTPRNDVLVNNLKKMKEKVHSFFDIDTDTKILLYAPTFRLDYSNNPYDIDFKLLKDELEKKYKKKWKVLTKLHPRITNSKKILNCDQDILDVTNYSDVQELICACDLLITDYSSTMFEALIADKPVIIYAKDIESYNEERGYYFTFEQLPFPLSKNNENLINIVTENNLEEIRTNYNQFKNDVGLIEKGIASKKICELILKELE